jgi:hypothetical protein
VLTPVPLGNEFPNQSHNPSVNSHDLMPSLFHGFFAGLFLFADKPLFAAGPASPPNLRFAPAARRLIPPKGIIYTNVAVPKLQFWNKLK